MDSETFINNVLGETIDQIVNGKNNLPESEKAKLKGDVPFADSNFFTWCTPGIPVNAEDFAFLKGLRRPVDPEKWQGMSEEDRETARGDASYELTVAMDNFSLLVDTVPNKSGMIDSLQVWEPQNRISHIYGSLFDSTEVADTVTSPHVQERIDKIRAELMPQTVTKTTADGLEVTEEMPSKLETAYTYYAVEYNNALEKYIDLMGKAVTGSAADVQKASMLGPQLYKMVSTAYDKWETSGFKSKYEKLTADLSQLEGTSMSLLKKQYEEIFRRSTRTSLIDSLDYNVARIVPAGFYDSGGWTGFSFSSSQLKSTDLTKTQKYSGGARYAFFGGAKGSHTRLDTSNSISFDSSKIEFELTQVPIVRSWFREDFLLSNKWRFKPGTTAAGTEGKGVLSSGDPADPRGSLFAYPTVFIFARNIKLSRSTYEKMQTEATRSTDGKGGFNLGPFSMGAKASYNTTEKDLQVTQQDDMMVVNGMQAIGFRNHILPLCPDPDPEVTAWI